MSTEQFSYHHPLQIQLLNKQFLITVIHSFHILELNQQQETDNPEETTLLQQNYRVQSYPETEVEWMPNIIDKFKLIKYSEMYQVGEFFLDFIFITPEIQLYFYGKRVDKRLFHVVVSQLYAPSFFQELFNQIEPQAQEERLLSIILTFSRMPIQPLFQMNYTFSLVKNRTPLSLSFLSTSGVIEDSLHASCTLSLFTPVMIVKAWESIIIGRRIIVVSQHQQILSPCIEFIRSLVSPMKMKAAFHHFLSRDMIQFLEGESLVGVSMNPFWNPNNDQEQKEIIQSLNCCGHENMVIDLDHGNIEYYSSNNDSFRSSPISLFQTILAEIENYYQLKNTELSKFLRRSSISKENTIDKYYSGILSKVIQFFSSLNSSLLSAQYCGLNRFLFDENSSVSFTIRKVHGIRSTNDLDEEDKKAFVDPVLHEPGYVEINGSMVGQLKYWGPMSPESNNKTDYPLLDCWVECDAYLILVYQYTDQLPILSIRIKDISIRQLRENDANGVTSFEIKCYSSQIVYRFTAATTIIRDAWITDIGQRLLLYINKRLTFLKLNKQQMESKELLNEEIYQIALESDKVPVSKVNCFSFHPEDKVSSRIHAHYQEFRLHVFRSETYSYFNEITEFPLQSIIKVREEYNQPLKLSENLNSGANGFNIENQWDVESKQSGQLTTSERVILITKQHRDYSSDNNLEGNVSNTNLGFYKRYIRLTDCLIKWQYQNLKYLYPTLNETGLTLFLDLSDVIETVMTSRPAAEKELQEDIDLQLEQFLQRKVQQASTTTQTIITTNILGLHYFLRKNYQQAFLSCNIVPQDILGECACKEFMNETRGVRWYKGNPYLNQVLIELEYLCLKNPSRMLRETEFKVRSYEAGNLKKFVWEKHENLAYPYVCNYTYDQDSTLIITLLEELFDILHYESMTAAKNTMNCIQKKEIRSETDLKTIRASPSFQLLHHRLCQLQCLDWNQIKSDETKLQTFINLFNLLTIHGIISNGLPILSQFDFDDWKERTKYQLGGYIFSLSEIENAILRNKMYVESEGLKFNDADDRGKFALQSPNVNIHVALVGFYQPAPTIQIFRDPSTIKKELLECSINYFNTHSTITTTWKGVKINCPDLLKIFARDLPEKENRNKIIDFFLRKHQRDLYDELCEKGKTKKVYVKFSGGWKFQINEIVMNRENQEEINTFRDSISNL